MNDAAVSDPNLPRSADALQPAETKLLPNVSHNAGFGMTISAVGTLETCRLFVQCPLSGATRLGVACAKQYERA